MLSKNQSTSVPTLPLRKIKDVALFFGVSPQAVQAWRDRGMPGSIGHFEAGAIARWLRERQADDRDRTGSKSDHEGENAKWAAELKKLRFAKEIGQLVDRGAVTAELTRLLNTIRQRLQAIPAELASGVEPSKRADFQIDLDSKIRLILTEMAAWAETNGPKPATSPKKKPRKSTPTKKPTKGRNSR